MSRRAEKRERNTAICEAYRQPGASLKTVAAEFGITWMRVRQILQRMGVERRPPTGMGKPRKRYNRAAKLDGDGERVSLSPHRRLYACPGCGCRALTPLGHVGCIGREEAA